MTRCYLLQRYQGTGGALEVLACYKSRSDARKHAQVEIGRLRSDASLLKRHSQRENGSVDASELWTIWTHDNCEVIKIQEMRLLDSFSYSGEDDLPSMVDCNNEQKNVLPNSTILNGLATKRLQAKVENTPVKRRKTGKDKIRSNSAPGGSLNGIISTPMESDSKESDSKRIPISREFPMPVYAEAGSAAPIDLSRDLDQVKKETPSIDSGFEVPGIVLTTPPSPRGGTRPSMPPNPSWLDQALDVFISQYPHDRFEGMMRYSVIDRSTGHSVVPPPRSTTLPDEMTFAFLPGIRCHDCPGKAYTVGPGHTAGNFEIHLKNREHRRAVDKRCCY